MSSERRFRVATERVALVRAFAEKVRELRLAGGLSQEGLAENCRVSLTTIYKIERGQYELRLRMIKILCDGLGVTPDALIGDLPVPQERNKE